MLLALQLLNLLAQDAPATVYPTIFAGLDPVVTDADELDAPALTNLGTAISYNANGTYTTSAGPTEYASSVLIQRYATGDWHPEASPPDGFKFFIGGTVRAPEDGLPQAVAIAEWQALGFTVTLNSVYSAIAIGTVIDQSVYGVPVTQYDLLTPGVVTLTVSVGIVNTPRSRTFVIDTRAYKRSRVFVVRV